MLLASIDPGLRKCGVAVWEDGKLVRAELVRGIKNVEGPWTWRSMAEAVRKYAGHVDSVAIELPQVYRPQKIPSADLIQLTAVVGAICQELYAGFCVAYLPREWKGSVPKEITELRAKSRLSATELASIRLPCASDANNVWDAIGIGLFHLKR